MKQRQDQSMDTTSNDNHHAIDEEDHVAIKYMVGGSVVAIHSQVKKIKQELEKTMHPAALEHPEMTSVLREFSRQPKRSRSPLGITNRPISVGNSSKF